MSPITPTPPTHSLSSRLFRSPIAAACLIGVSIVAGAALHSSANPTLVPPPPTPVTVALVDLGRLMDGLHEGKTRNDANQAEGKKLQGELDTLTDQVEALQTSLKPGGSIPESDHRRRSEAMAGLIQKGALLKAMKESYQVLYDTRRGNIVHEFYDKIVIAVDAFAKREGYDLVLLDDRTLVQLPQLDTARAQDLLPMIEKRRILYAKDGIDVTDRLITIMNNQYDAANPPAPTPAPAPAPAPAPPSTAPKSGQK
jgi:Skp family chaperone for outer membrane proteins